MYIHVGLLILANDGRDVILTAEGMEVPVHGSSTPVSLGTFFV